MPARPAAWLACSHLYCPPPPPPGCNRAARESVRESAWPQCLAAAKQRSSPRAWGSGAAQAPPKAAIFSGEVAGCWVVLGAVLGRQSLHFQAEGQHTAHTLEAPAPKLGRALQQKSSAQSCMGRKSCNNQGLGHHKILQPGEGEEGPKPAHHPPPRRRCARQPGGEAGGAMLGEGKERTYNIIAWGGNVCSAVFLIFCNKVGSWLWPWRMIPAAGSPCLPASAAWRRHPAAAGHALRSSCAPPAYARRLLCSAPGTDE